LKPKLLLRPNLLLIVFIYMFTLMVSLLHLMPQLRHYMTIRLKSKKPPFNFLDGYYDRLMDSLVDRPDGPTYPIWDKYLDNVKKNAKDEWIWKEFWRLQRDYLYHKTRLVESHKKVQTFMLKHRLATYKEVCEWCQGLNKNHPWAKITPPKKVA